MKFLKLTFTLKIIVIVSENYFFEVFASAQNKKFSDKIRLSVITVTVYLLCTYPFTKIKSSFYVEMNFPKSVSFLKIQNDTFIDGQATVEHLHKTVYSANIYFNCAINILF